MRKIGILFTNTGTPDAPTTAAVRRYLREFLSDKRIVHLPRIIWLPILYGIILPLRPRKSARLYKNIWTADGSPMRKIMHNLAEKLNGGNLEVALGMNYGNPSIRHGLEKLREKQVDEIIVLPLFPQYSDTSTASSFDRVEAAVKKWSRALTVKKIRDYADNPAYIRALAAQIEKTWRNDGPAQHLLISFHGIPERFVAEGDIYQSRCEITASLLAAALKLDKDKWTLCYQSQFGYDKWLKPSTQALFTELPQRGIKRVDIVCPGFAVDCLETLEEIAITGEESFLHAGGESLRYIPCLNDSEQQVDMLKMIIAEHTQ